MQVAQIMTRDPEVVTSDFILKDAALKMRDLDVGMLPIRSDDRLVGMLTDREYYGPGHRRGTRSCAHEG